MKLYIITEDLGDGDVGLRYFPSKEEAQAYIDKEGNEDWCYHESNPHVLDIDTIVAGTFKYYG